VHAFRYAETCSEGKQELFTVYVLYSSTSTAGITSFINKSNQTEALVMLNVSRHLLRRKLPVHIMKV